MAEKASLVKQFDYKANANLVLQPGKRDRREEASGAPVPLQVGKLKGKVFGDRAQRRTSRDAEFLKRLEKTKQPRSQDDETKRAKRQRLEVGSVLQATDAGQEEATAYRPRSRDTSVAWEALLTLVANLLGTQPDDVIRSAAYEILAVLKNDKLTDPERTGEIQSMLGLRELQQHDFHRAVDIGKKITDYSMDEEKVVEGEKLDDELGVAVVFDEDEDDDDEGYYIKDEASDDESEGVDDAEMLPALEADDVDDDDAEDERRARLDSTQIDAFWLQREISQFINDEHKAHQLAGEVLEILGEKDIRICENKLVLLLDMSRFSFVKILLKNRPIVYYCTRLKQAQDPEAKKLIEDEMEMDEEGQEVLVALRRTQSGAERRKDFEQKVREEARSLKANVRDTSAGKAQTGGTSMKANLVDLESLAFSTGGHFMSNKRCELPPGSFRTQRKGYEEVYVPALKPEEYKKGEKLVPIKNLPSWIQPVFSNVKSLNRIQSRVYDTAFKSPENLLMAAPTGAGKTNVALLTMLREIELHRDETTGEVDLDSFKIIYIAPMKSLVAEMVNNFGQKLKPFGISVKELTGDMSLTKQQIYETQVIVCTPEKWDIITRKAGDRAFTSLVRLIIIDEIHLLHDLRGPVLESIVARSVRQVETTQEMIRLVALSATLPNYEDVAAFLRVNEKGLFFFDNSYRPVPLDQQFIGITEKKSLKRFQLMNDVVYEKTIDNAGKNQVLVFVHSRKETAKTARYLRDAAIEKDTLGKFLREDSASREILRVEAESSTIKNPDLKELLPYGFAVHHAGMARSDRTLVEDLFADGHIQVLVSTATLAWGVNLPAHTVIIKGTQIYDPEKSKWTELGFQDIMQMLGRAGRPQYDTKGEGIVITQHSELQYYLSVMNQQLPIESQYMCKLADNLNAEIVLGTIRNVQEGIDWLSYTYLFVRMFRDPLLYGIPEAEAEEDKMLLQRRRDLIHSASLLLDKHGLVRYDRRSGMVQATDLGRVASYYYISYLSMATFNEHLKPTMSDIEVFRLFSLSNEFKLISVRDEEKVELQKLLERVPVPVKESAEEPSAKVNVLLQAHISQLPLSGFALLADMVYVTQSAIRIVRALHEVVLRRGWAQLADKLLNLAKMIDKRMWSSQCPLRQFKGMPEDLIKKIEKKDFPWERFFDLTPQELGELVRFEKMGTTIYKYVHQFPKLELKAHVQPITRSMLHVELIISPDFQFEDSIHGASEPFWVIVSDTDGEQILHHEYFILKQRYAKEDHILTFTVPIFEPLPPQYFVTVQSDRWIQSQTTLPVSFRHLILPEKFAPLTELLDLQPLPVTALQNLEYSALYKGMLTHFNPIQTQSFTSLYNTDDNVLLCAPTGSGKTLCAEFALFRAFTLNEDAHCVYIAPLPELCDERYADWRDKFGKLGKIVFRMTGQAGPDSKMLEKGHIVIGTPEQWDAVSRRWKQRRAVQNVNTFIIDELHLIGGSHGPVMEIIVSRMRFIASQTEKSIRIVGLASTLANAKDLGDWIGTTSHSLFAFHPNVRPVPLEIHIQGFDLADFSSRMLSMSKPAYQSILSHGGTKPVIVFAPNRRQAKMLAADLVSFASADLQPLRFLRCASEDIAPHAETLSSQALAECASMGVVFYHEGLDVRDRMAAKRIFEAGAVQVIVVDVSCCWELGLECHLSVIVGTERYDGRTHSYQDYPIADVLQMMGRASRPRLDDSGKCVILCYSPRKEFFKKFLYEPFPVESHLDHALADHLTAEIVTRTVENKQDAVDYLTWTFLYRRLAMNPNYYNLQGNSHRHISDHLSELIESTVSELEQSKCIAVEDEMDLSPLNLGMIAAYYYIRYTTVELFSSSLQPKSKLRAMLEILSAATEFDEVSVRDGEDQYLKKLAMRVRLPVAGSERTKYNHTATKINLLLQAHISRMPLGMNQRVDLNQMLVMVPRLLQAAVDVISSNGWLRPALAAMELSQLVVQAVWEKDSHLKQVPHISDEILKRAESKKIENIFDLMELDDKVREKLLQLSPKEMADVAEYCNRYPSVDVSHEVLGADEITTGDPVSIQIGLEREMDEEEMEKGPGPVIAPFYPESKEEGWWIVVGDPEANVLHSVKRVVLQQRSKARLDFEAPSAPGKYKYMLYLMCDSYVGCDQEYEFDVVVKEGGDMSDDE